jgi:AcrR family transcriptional regulator
MLYEALLDLIIEKGYEAITVQDLIDRANIGRSTFYSHFLDKEQLLLGNIGKLSEFLKQQFATRSLPEISGEYRFSFSLAMLQHVHSHKRIYKAVAGKQSGVLVLFHMQRMLVDLVREEIVVLLPSSASSSIPQDIAIEFVVNTFWSLLTWWMDQKTPYSAAEMDRMFHTLTLSGINALQ